MLSATDWIAVATVALPLIAKVLIDWQTSASARHNDGLARVVGMAAREAAGIGRALQEMPPGTPGRELESRLINNAVHTVGTEMDTSSMLIGADTSHLRTIVQGELNKLIVKPVPNIPRVVAVAVPAI